jgi:hypothetical protein
MDANESLVLERWRWGVWLTIWLALNFLQAATTNLTADEAYYWLYSQRLDWGYFDHPPMISFFIWLGQGLGGTLGVRLISVLAQGLTLWVLWRVVIQRAGTRNPLLFFSLAFGLFIFQAFGFIATPDSPLLLFAALFLWSYDRFLQRPNWKEAILLGTISAALLYSKYHGLLLIGFTVLSHLSWFRRSTFYLAALWALLLFSPHILWQYVHDFPSFRYHLVERVEGFQSFYILEYLGNVLLVYNPFFIPFVAIALAQPRWSDPFSRALFAIVLGFLLFFLLSSVRGHVQPQWTATITLPLILGMYWRFVDDPLRLWVYRAAAFSLPLVLVVRLFLVVNFFPALPSEFHRGRSNAEALGSVSGDTPVLFENSYRLASEYAFYNQRLPAFSGGVFNGRKTQFELWQWETHFHRKAVLWAGRGSRPGKAQVLPDGDTLYLTYFERFPAYHKARAYLSPPNSVLLAGAPCSLTFELFNPYPFPVDFSGEGQFQLKGILRQSGPSPIASFDCAVGPPRLPPGERVKLAARATLPVLPPGEYQLGLCWQLGDLPPWPAGNWIKVSIQ